MAHDAIIEAPHRDLRPCLDAGPGPGHAAPGTPDPRQAPRSAVVDEFIDQVTGTTADRPQLHRLWQAVGARKVDALEEFQHLGVDFISITEQIDTSSPMGKAMFTVISAIAEFERSLISERVRAGIAKARANGKPHGRPPITAELVQEIHRRRRQGQSCNQTARQLEISHQTVAN